mmetsp:Transcript_18163/g.28373  ORF Transcript_18163/g.28373 Transcript_18163/m.28373 type:complete len:697 (-) Transcript_18163:5201-7291(-)
MRLALDAHRQAIAGFDMGDVLALLVHQEIGDANRAFDQDLAGPATCAFLFDLTQDRQGQIVVRPDQAGAVTGRTGLCRGLDHARTQTLARHFHQAKAGNAAQLDARTVRLELFLHHLFDLGVVAPVIHVDEVNDDQARQIAQTQLARHLFGSLQVGLGRGFLDGAFFGRPTRVHVDGHKRLGDADHDITTRFQLNRRVEHAGQVRLDLIAGKERQAFGIELHVFGVGRHDHFHEVLGGAVAPLALDKDLVNLAVIEVADRTFDQVAFFIDFRGRNGFQRQLADLLPQAEEVFIVALDLCLGPLCASGAHDQTRPLRHIDLVRDFLELFAVSGVGDLAADAAATGRVGHQNAIPTGQRQVCGQGGTLVAALFLDDLHQQDLADLDDFLDFVAARARFAHRADIFAVVLVRDGFDAIILGSRIGRLGCIVVVVIAVGVRLVRSLVICRGVGGGLWRLICFGIACGRLRLDHSFFGNRLVCGRGFNRRFLDGLHRGCRLGRVNLGLGVAVGVQINGFHPAHFGRSGGIIILGRSGLGFGGRPAPGGFRLGLVFFLVTGLLGLGIGAFFGHQGLAVGHGDLIVIRMNFREREEAMAIAAIVHKGRLKRRFNPCYFCEIDVAGKLAFVFRFKVEFLNLVSVHHHDAGLFRVGGIDKHFLGHSLSLHNSASAAPGGATDLGSCLFWAIRDARQVGPISAPAG